jgi:hypothetical protein
MFRSVPAAAAPIAGGTPEAGATEQPQAPGSLKEVLGLPKPLGESKGALVMLRIPPHSTPRPFLSAGAHAVPLKPCSPSNADAACCQYVVVTVTCAHASGMG